MTGWLLFRSMYEADSFPRLRSKSPGQDTHTEESPGGERGPGLHRDAWHVPKARRIAMDWSWPSIHAEKEMSVSFQLQKHLLFSGPMAIRKILLPYPLDSVGAVDNTPNRSYNIEYICTSENSHYSWADAAGVVNKYQQKHSSVSTGSCHLSGFQLLFGPPSRPTRTNFPNPSATPRSNTLIRLGSQIK